MRKCLFCQMEQRTPPCNGDPVFVGEELVRTLDASGEPSDTLEWPSECLLSASVNEPEFSFTAILAAIPMLETSGQAAYLAASDLEDIIARYGEQFINRIEQHAAKSARFRFVLSGVWPQGKADTQIWTRIEAARAQGPSMDAGSPLPKA